MTTAIAEKLAAKGMIPRNVRFQIALAEFQNNGGEYGVALAMLNAAYGKGGKDNQVLPRGHKENSDAPLQNGGEGRIMRADMAEGGLPSPSTDRSAGRGISADEAISGVPVAANKPGHAKRGLRSISAVQDTVSKSLFDITLLPDGRRLRDVRWSECPALAGKYRRLSRIFMAVHQHATPADPNVTLDAIVNEDGLAEIIGAVERVNDLH